MIKKNQSGGNKKFDDYKAKRKEKAATVLGSIKQMHDKRRETEAIRKAQEAAKKLEEDIVKKKKLEEAYKNYDWGTIAMMKIDYLLTNIIGGFKDGLFKWIVGPLLFACLAPALPLFIFMAGLFAVFKYIMGYLKKI